MPLLPTQVAPELAVGALGVVAAAVKVDERAGADVVMNS